MSSSFWWNDEDFLNSILKLASKSYPESVFYLDSGDSGPDNDDRD